MVMLSQLLRYKLIDAQGEQTRPRDFSVDLLDGDYPPVTRVFFRNAEKQKRYLPWAAVESVDERTRVIKTSNFKNSVPVSAESMAEIVLLRAGVLDALILDLENRRATRANDLLLEQDRAGLLLRGADTGFRAMLRRLTRGRYGGISHDALFDWKYVEFLRGEPNVVRSESGKHLRISRLPPSEIARLTDALPYLHAAELITLLADPKAADTLEAMTPERQLQVLEELDEDQALRLLTLMAPDIATDLLARLQTPLMRRYLELLPRNQAERIIELLRYPENSVGSIMTNDVLFVPGNLTVAEARLSLQKRLADPDFIYFIYVVDDESSRRLRGVISIRSLITAPDQKKLEEIMDPYLSTLGPLDSAYESSFRVLDSQLAALPVVASDKQLLGVVTVDAALTQVAPSNWGAQAPRIFS